MAGYPFRFPSRVFFNPYDVNEVWVTSFGNGMRLGRVNEPQPVFLGVQRTNQTSSITIAAAPGQKIVVAASSNLQTWTPIATNVMYTNQVSVSETSSAAQRFFRAVVP